jgi:hypothetical protein
VVTTTYIVTVIDGISIKTDSITVTVNDNPTANAGLNASYTDTVTMFPVAGTATNYRAVKWLTAGDGHFNFDTMLSCNYYPGINDRSDGGVLLSLKADPLIPCSDTALDTVYIKLTFPLGVATVTIVQFNVNILPNPASGTFNLVIHGAGDLNLKLMITDIEGKTVFIDQDTPHSQDILKSIDIKSFPGGIYMVRVQTDLQSITKKLVIQ